MAKCLSLDDVLPGDWIHLKGYCDFCADLHEFYTKVSDVLICPCCARRLMTFGREKSSLENCPEEYLPFVQEEKLVYLQKAFQ